MALRHFKEYYKKVESQQFKMVEDAKEFDKLLKEGKVAPEQVEQIQTMLSKVTENYKRLTYIAYLLQLPNRKNKETKSRNQKIENYLKEDSDKAIYLENEDVLKRFKDYIKEVKNG